MIMMTFRLSCSLPLVPSVSSENILRLLVLCPLPSIKAFYFSASSGFIRLTFCPKFLLAFCDTLPEVAFFVLFLGRVRLSSFCVVSSNIARR